MNAILPVTVSEIILNGIFLTLDFTYGQTLKELQNQVRLPELETLLNYCYQHAERRNPLQNLIDKGFLSLNFTGETCISVKQLYNEFEEKYRILLIEEFANSK